MKIGIVTLYNAVNYGAFLQAFCLQEVLKSMGDNDVKMIKSTSVLYEKWRFQALFSYKPKKIRFKLNLLINYLNCWKKFCKAKKKEKFDLVIVGSDEMWNLKNITVKPLPQFFGLNIAADKFITYAVSCNNTVYEDVIKSEMVKNGLKKFTSISVRDEATLEAYQPLVNKKIRMDLDPTFLVDLNNYVVECEEENYILVYTYGFDEQKISQVKNLAVMLNKKIIVVGQNFSWADKSVPANPFEFLGYIKNADIVITDTFHGTILSIGLRKQFMSYANQKPKVSKILKQLDLMDRNISEVEDISSVYENSVNYAVVDEKLAELRELSNEYLKSQVLV